MAIISSGITTLTDLNDAIISGTQPVNPTVGTLWIDSSKSPAILKIFKNGAWVTQDLDLDSLDPDMAESIRNVVATIGNMSNDNLLDYKERQIIKDDLTEILGKVMLDTETVLPTVSQLDNLAKGSFYSTRQNALNAGLEKTNSVYVDTATQYQNLKTYLESLTPVKPWNTDVANKDKNVTVVKNTFRDKWLQYYLATEKLNLATTEKIKEVQEELDGKIDEVSLRDKTEILSGNPVFTDKSDDAVVHVGVDGKSVGGGSGKNLYAYGLVIGNLVGNPLVYKRPDIGGIQIDTTSAGVNSIRIGKVISKNGTYTVSFEIKANKNVSNFGTDICDTGGNSDNESSVSTSWTSYKKTSIVTNYSAGVYHFLDFNFNTSEATTIEIKNLQIEEGATVTTYEPPAPSPDYPIAINSLDKSFDIVSSVGRENFVKNSDILNIETTGNTLPINIMSLGKVTLPFVTGETYTLSFDLKADISTTSPNIFLTGGLNVTKTFEFSTNWTRQYITFVYNGQNYGNYQIYPHLYPTGSGMKYVRRCKLEKGEFSPYSIAPEDISYDTQSPTLYKTNILLSEPLRSVGDVKDRLFLDTDGLWKVERNVGVSTINKDTSISTTIDKTGGNNYYFDNSCAFIVSGITSDMKSSTSYQSRLVSSHLKETTENNYNSKTGVKSNSIHKIQEASTRLFVRLDNNIIGLDDTDTNATANAKFRTWLVNNPITVQYELAILKIETLSAEEQTKLNNIQSFKGSNYVYTMAGVVPNLNAQFKSNAWYRVNVLGEQLTYGNRNWARNGNLAYLLEDSAWSGYYKGTVREIVDISSDAPPFKNALHIKQTTSGVAGIIDAVIWEGAEANVLTGQSISMATWLKYQNVVNSDLVMQVQVTGKKSDGTFVYDYPKVFSITGTDMTWQRRTGTVKINLFEGATEITRVMFRLGFAKAGTGEFWATGIQLETGTALGDWSPNPDDVQGDLDATKAQLILTEKQVALRVTKGNVINEVNVDPTGVRIKGEKFTVDADTEFNANLTMNKGVIKSADGGTVLDLNNNTLSLDKPFSIGNTKSATVADVNNAQTAINAEIKDVSDTANSLKDFTNTAFSDGIIQIAEAQAISEHLNTLKKENDDLGNQYTGVYANSLLVGVPKTNLLNAKTAYNTAYANLITSINTAISGNKTTTAQKTDVDAKFTLYSNSLKLLTQRMNESLTSISGKQATDAVSGVQSELNDVTLATTALKNLTDTAFTDNIIQVAEAQAISEHLNTLKKENDDLSNQYNTTYANTNLTGTSKTNLYNSKVAYNTAYTNLVSSVNSAISGNKTTTAQKSDVDAKFASYSTALKLLTQRLYESLTAISETLANAVAVAKANLAEVNAKAHADGKVTAEEERAIADAKAKLVEAQAYADNIEFGGINLLGGFTKKVQGKNGITFTLNDNGSAKFTGTKNSSVTDFYLLGSWGDANTNSERYLEAGTYTLSSTSPMNRVSLKIYQGNNHVVSLMNKRSQTFTLTAGTYYSVVYITVEDTSVFNDTIGFKLERGAKATDWTPAVADIDAMIAQAQADADIAKTSSGTANQLLADLSNDNILTPVEKKSVKKEWDIIVSEKVKIDAEATEYSISAEKSLYNNYYTALNSYTSSLLANLNTNSTIVGTTFRTNFKNYYDARQDLLNAITSKAKALADSAQGTADNVKGVVSNFDSAIINANPIFLDWTGELPTGYSGVTGGTSGISRVVSGNGMGNAIKYNVLAGSSGLFLNPLTVTTAPFYNYVTVEFTFKLESGTIDGAGVLFRYIGNGNTDHRIHIKDSISSPTLNKWYTVTKTIKQSSIPAGFTGYQVYPMGSWASFGATITAKTIQFDSLKTRKASEQEINAYESSIMIADMSSDSKITPVEKVQLKKEWATIASERASLDSIAGSYVVGIERTNMTNAYNTLNTVLNGTGGILTNMSTTSTVTATTFRAQFDDYYEKKAILQKKVSEIAKTIGDGAQSSVDNLEIGGKNLLRETQYTNNSMVNILKRWNISTNQAILRKADWAFVVDTPMYNKDVLSLATTYSAPETESIQVYFNPLGDNGEQYITLEPNSNYTFSGKYYHGGGTGQFTFVLYEYDNAGGNRTKVGNTVLVSDSYNSSFKDMNFSFTTTDKKFYELRFYVYASDQATSINFHIYNFQLEKGTKATSWSPASEDIESNITQAQIDAKNASDLAKNAGALAGTKTETYTSTPTIPYKAGDVWKNGTAVYISTATRSSGSFTSADWVLVGDVTSNNTAKDVTNVGGTLATTIRDRATNGNTAYASTSLWKKAGYVTFDGGNIHADTITSGAIISDVGIINKLFASDANINALTAKTAFINSVKAVDISANKITTGTLVGISLKSSASNGSTFEVVGNNLKMTKANGDNLIMDTSGVYWKNSAGATLFQTSNKLTTSDIFGTAEHNVYLASFNESRSVTYATALTGVGAINDYNYVPHRALGYYGQYLENNSGAPGSHIYIRPEFGYEARVTKPGTTDDYQAMRVNTSFVERIDLNTYDTSSNHLYIGTPDEVRIASSIGASNGSGVLRAAYLYTANLILNDVDTGATYLNIRGNSGVRIRNVANDEYKQIYASAFNVSSSRDFKKGIEDFEESALNIINTTPVREYWLNDEIEEIDYKHVGLIVQESPKEIVNFKGGDTIDTYAMTSVLWKGVQELNTEVKELKQQLLEMENK